MFYLTTTTTCLNQLLDLTGTIGNHRLQLDPLHGDAQGPRSRLHLSGQSFATFSQDKTFMKPNTCQGAAPVCTLVPRSSSCSTASSADGRLSGRMTKVEAGKAREVEERERRRGEWRSIRGLFKLNTIPPLVDTFKVSLLDTTLIANVKKI